MSLLWQPQPKALYGNYYQCPRSPEACATTTFVITLGKSLLQEKQRDWIDMDAAADFCRQHGVQLNGEYLSAAELETTLRQVIPATGEFYTPGVNVDGYDRPKGWDRPFQIRAYPYNSAGQSQPVEVAGTQEPVLAGPEADIAKIGNTVSILPPPIPIPNDLLSIP